MDRSRTKAVWWKRSILIAENCASRLASSVDRPQLSWSIGRWKEGKISKLNRDIKNYGERSCCNHQAADSGRSSQPGATRGARSWSEWRKYHGLLQRVYCCNPETTQRDPARRN